MGNAEKTEECRLIHLHLILVLNRSLVILVSNMSFTPDGNRDWPLGLHVFGKYIGKFIMHL